MTGGLGFLIGQNAALPVTAAVLGGVFVRVVMRRRSGRRSISAPTDPGLLASYERRWRSAQAEADQLRSIVTETADRKDTEMGRLETGAIRALDSTNAAHQRRLADVEARLADTEAAVRETEQQLDDERRRADRLQTALAERDRQLAAFTTSGRSGTAPRTDGQRPRTPSGDGHPDSRRR